MTKGSDDEKEPRKSDEGEEQEKEESSPRSFSKVKFWLIACSVIALLGGGYLCTAHLSGGALFTFGLPLGGDEGQLRRITMRFLEDLQFKDYAKAATYHAPDLQKTVDIPYLLHRLFRSPPELLDIMEYEVLWVDLDSSGERARVRTRVKAKHLPTDNIQEANIMLYFNRDTAYDPWYMILEDSLRAPDSDPNKRH